MRYLFLYSPSKVTPPTPEHFQQMGQYIDEMTKAGIHVLSGGFSPSKEDARVRLADGKLTVTDGPFTESKELIAGFAICEVKSKEHAVEVAKQFLQIAGDGVSEFHPLIGG
jgi:hypothetical protein